MKDDDRIGREILDMDTLYDNPVKLNAKGEIIIPPAAPTLKLWIFLYAGNHGPEVFPVFAAEQPDQTAVYDLAQAKFVEWDCAGDGESFNDFLINWEVRGPWQIPT